MEFHVTDISTFKTCRRAWKYKCIEHLHKNQESQGALWIGRMLHFGLAAYYEQVKEDGKVPAPKDEYRDLLLSSADYWLSQKVTKAVRDKMWPGEVVTMNETVELVNDLLTGYLDKYYMQDKFEVVAVEEPIRVQIPGTEHFLVGTLDMVVRMKGKLWVLDHKGYKTFVEPKVLELDYQMSAYCYLLWKKFGEYPAGAIYNQIRKSIPCEPMLLKDGKKLSSDKSIDTTVAKYLATIEKHGFEISDYEGILAKLEGNEFFRRELISRNKNELQTFENNLVLEALDMARAVEENSLYPSPTKDCLWMCSDFQTLCKCENENGNTKGLKDMMYFVDENRLL